MRRCFHPFKGMFAALVGAAPFVAFAVVYAVLTRPITYTLGVLPVLDGGAHAPERIRRRAALL